MSLDNVPRPTAKVIVAGSLLNSARMSYSVTPVSINAGATYTAFSYTGVGSITHIMTRHENDKHEFVLEIDGLTIISFRPKDIDDTFGILDDASKKALPYWTDNKTFSIYFQTPVSFASSFAVKIKNTDTSAKLLLGHSVLYRI